MTLDRGVRIARGRFPLPPGVRTRSAPRFEIIFETLSSSRCPYARPCVVYFGPAARPSPYDQWEVAFGMFGNASDIVSIMEIKRFYPDQWVAVAVTETDADGFALKGEVITHDSNEQFVWTAIKLGESEDPIYVFFTGSRQRITAAA